LSPLPRVSRRRLKQIRERELSFGTSEKEGLVREEKEDSRFGVLAFSSGGLDGKTALRVERKTVFETNYCRVTNDIAPQKKFRGRSEPANSTSADVCRAGRAVRRSPL
jgi:hypothetical protein